MPLNRQILLVDKQVQGAIVRQSILHWFYLAATTVVLLVVMRALRDGVLKPWGEHWQAVWPVMGAVLLAFLVLLPKFVRDYLALSNRFAGPVMRLRNSLRDLAAGKPYKPLEFRRDDFWSELAGDLSAAVERLSTEETLPSDVAPECPPESRSAARHQTTPTAARAVHSVGMDSRS